MNDTSDRALERWLGEGPEVGPAEPLRLVLAATRATRQRPGWAVRDWWVWPAGQRSTSPLRLLPIYLLTIAALIGLVAALVIGAQRRLPPPAGIAGNGLISLIRDGRMVLVDAVRGDERPVPGGLGLEYSGEFSPDGTRLAFWSRRSPGEPLHMLVTDVNSAHTVQVEGSLSLFGQEVYPPTWSPDGARLAFAVRSDGALGLFVAEADGSFTRAITNETVAPTSPVWSPDGGWIAFRGIDSPLVPQPRGLFIVRPDGTDLRQLFPSSTATSPAQPFVDMEPPQWTVDGRALLVSFGTGARRAVGVVGLDAALREIGPRPGDGRAAVLSPDGRLVAYINEFGDLEVVNIDGTGRRVIAEGAALCDLWGWSPDATQILAASEGCAETTTVDVASGDVSTVAEDVAYIKVDWQRVAP